jgi:hypothetical protein
VRIKSNRNGRNTQSLGSANDLGHDDLVSAVDPVKNADGDDTAAARG